MMKLSQKVEKYFLYLKMSLKYLINSYMYSSPNGINIFVCMHLYHQIMPNIAFEMKSYKSTFIYLETLCTVIVIMSCVGC